VEDHAVIHGWRLWIAAVAAATALAFGCAGFHGAPLAGAPEGATFVDVDGVHVHYRDAGKGPAVVMIHGYSASIDLWRPVQDALAAQHRVIAIDLKGFGWTSRPAGDYSPAAQAALVWGVLDALGVADVAVVGHSWGSSVALAMTLARPERVRRIALYSAYVFEAQVPSFLRWARVDGIGELLFALHYRNNVEDRVGLAYHDPRFVTQARVEHVERELARPGTVAAALAAARGQRFTRQERQYGDIAQPVLLLWGDDDLVTPLRHGQRLANVLPDARLDVYPACGHIPMVEAFGPTTRDLRRFLAADVKREEPPTPHVSEPEVMP
jgi:pimeloyl-ACP methyl ester carboxylesterase